MKMADTTNKHTVRKCEVRYMSAPAASLRCEARINFHKQPTSISCFVGQTVKEKTPRCICYRLCKTMILQHVENLKILNTNDSKSIDDLLALLMSKITAFIGNPFVNASDYFTAMLSFFTSLCRGAQFPLCLCQFF